MGNLEILLLTLSRDGDGDDEEKYSEDGGVAVQEEKPRLKRPPLYKVVLLNDDYTPMEFVVEVLQRFFNKDREEAIRVMLAVHTKGKAGCGVYSRDVAETKAAQVNDFSREHGHPLLCEMEACGDEEGE